MMRTIMLLMVILGLNITSVSFADIDGCTTASKANGLHNMVEVLKEELDSAKKGQKYIVVVSSHDRYYKNEDFFRLAEARVKNAFTALNDGCVTEGIESYTVSLVPWGYDMYYFKGEFLCNHPHSLKLKAEGESDAAVTTRIQIIIDGKER